MRRKCFGASAVRSKWAVLFYCFVVALSLGSHSRAAILGQATKTRDFSNSPANFITDTGLNTAAANQQWQGWELSAFSDSGETITGVILKIEGVLHQRWNIVEDEGIFPTPQSSSTATGDSHVLRSSTGTLFLTESEDNNTNNANPHAVPLADTPGRDYGAGSFLESTWAIFANQASTSIDLAYLVIPEFLNGDPLDGPYYDHPDFEIDIDIAYIPFGGDPGGEPLIWEMDECNFFGPCGPAEIRVTGNGQNIANGDVTPSTADHTDFGTVEMGSVQLRTYTIHNDGFSDLDLEYFEIFGDPEVFSIVGDFPTSINPNESADFTIALDTSALGSFTATLFFLNDDEGVIDDQESPFIFNIAATVIPEPASLMLFGLAMLGLVGFVRHGRAG